MKIFVVDDENIVLESCRRVLEAADHKVHVFDSVEKVLKVIDDGLPSLFIIDVKMPGLSGLDLIIAIRKKFSDVPILVMTGYNIYDTMDEAFKAGASEFISKPFTPDELLEIVREMNE